MSEALRFFAMIFGPILIVFELVRIVLSGKIEFLVLLLGIMLIIYGYSGFIEHDTH